VEPNCDDLNPRRSRITQLTGLRAFVPIPDRGGMADLPRLVRLSAMATAMARNCLFYLLFGQLLSPGESELGIGSLVGKKVCELSFGSIVL
jgi:hypothetical protein